jgi:putative transcriptional regulator
MMNAKSKRRKMPALRAAESITRGMRQIEAMIRDGAKPRERFTVRTVGSLDEPKTYEPADVRAVRSKLNLSQPVFADLMGVSAILVQSWEQGKRKPSRMACRLLEEIERNPEPWIARVRRGSPA